MRVEVLLHQFSRGAFEVSEVVNIGETCRRDFGAGGQGAQNSYCRPIEGAVGGKELVILIFAHRQTL
jgi:hypothetical protein